MDAKETVKDIKSQFRLYMNGPVSQNMRESGLDYRVNYGIDLPRLNELASGYEKNHEVAQELWKDHVRESKIMAGLLQPMLWKNHFNGWPMRENIRAYVALH